MRIYRLIDIACLLLMTSCTYSITLVHTEGTASDVVDETQRADPTTSTDLNLSGIPL